MSRSLALAVLLLLLGSGVCHSAPPKTTSLKEAWQDLSGKCGLLGEKGGIYEFLLDTIDPREGRDCIGSIGLDVVMFEENRNGGPHLGSPQTYLVVPMDRLVLRIRQ